MSEKKLKLLVLIILFCTPLFTHVRTEEGTQYSRFSPDSVRVLLQTGADAGYRNADGENLLHLAIRSADLQLIKEIFRKFPELQERSTKNGKSPAFYAVAFGRADLVFCLDSLGVNIWSNIGTAFTRLYRKTIKNDSDADSVFALVYNSSRKWPALRLYTWDSEWGAEEWFRYLKEFRQLGYVKAAAALDTLFWRFPDSVVKLMNHCSSYKSDDLSLMAELFLPATREKGLYFFKAIRTKNSNLIQAFIDQGAVLNDRSVHNEEVVSPLTIAQQTGDKNTVNILKKAGATDSIWYELLVPGYWPTLHSMYYPGRVWYSIMASGDSVSIEKSELNPNFFTIQRDAYWKNAKDRVLFFVMTNKTEGITTIKTKISRPHLLKPNDTLTISLLSGQNYRLIRPMVKFDALECWDGNNCQSLLNKYGDYYDTRTSPPNSIWVVWAGDLDNDRKLDILLTIGQVDDNQMANTYYLALSSLATKGQVVGWADEVMVYNNFDQYAQAHYSGNGWETMNITPFYEKEYSKY